MSNLVVSTVSSLDLPDGVRLTEQGLDLPAGLSFGEWEEVGQALFWIKERLVEAQETTAWAIGDWLDYGEFKYGEKFAQAVEMFGRSESRLQNIQWVARNIPPQRRRKTLSFRHHAEVAGLEPRDQDKLLSRAEQEGLTSQDVRQERRKLTGGEEYAKDDAEIALDNAVDAVKHLPVRSWAVSIMGGLVKPLKHEARPNAYWQFLNDMLVRIEKWRDQN